MFDMKKASSKINPQKERNEHPGLLCQPNTKLTKIWLCKKIYLVAYFDSWTAIP